MAWMGHHLRLEKAEVQTKRPKPSGGQFHGCCLKPHIYSKGHHTAKAEGGRTKADPGQVLAADDCVMCLFTVALAVPTAPKGSRFQGTFLIPEVQPGRQRLHSTDDVTQHN